METSTSELVARAAVFILSANSQQNPHGAPRCRSRHSTCGPNEAGCWAREGGAGSCARGRLAEGLEDTREDRGNVGAQALGPAVGHFGARESSPVLPSLLDTGHPQREGAGSESTPV